MHPYETFPRQFLLAKQIPDLPDDWAADSIADWTFRWHPTLHVNALTDQSGAKIGWLLGHLVDLAAGRTCREDFELPFAGSQTGTEKHAAITAAMRHWAGCFLLIVIDGGFQRAYSDAGATIPSVYSLETGALASTAAMLLPDDDFWRQLDRELVETAEIEADGWLPFGLTAHNGVRRLLPNHYYDLTAGSVVRWWPDFDIVIDDDTEAAADEITDILRRTTAILARTWNLTVPFTAGFDSRTVLAACRDHLATLETFTLRLERFTADEILATRIARNLGLRHRVLPIVRSTEEQTDGWMRRIGYCSGGSHMRQHQTMKALDTDRAYLIGFGGELARGRLWKDSDRPEDQISVRQLLMRFDFPMEPKMVAAGEQWLAGLEHIDAMVILDLLQLEHGMACRVPPQIYGPDFVYQDFYPFMQRRYFDLVMCLPYDYRRGERLYGDIYARSWPALNDYPFNSIGRTGDVLILFNKLWDLQRIRRKLRQLRG